MGVLGLLMASGDAAARAPQDAPAESVPPSAADALYDEGTRLMEQGDYERACPKLAESHRLDPSAGALLALARCHEKAGHLATAWSTYAEAATLARQKGDAAREAAARTQMDGLDPRLPRLIVRLDPGWDRVRDAVIQRNGIPVRLAELGTPLRVDPGVVVIEARAAGRVVQRREVRATEAQTVEVTLDAPARVAAAAAAAPTATAAPGNGIDAPPLASWIAAGVGVVGLGVFAGFGIASANAASELDACRNPCPTSLEETAETGARNQVIADVGLGVGAAALTTAVVLWIVWPDDPPPARAALRAAPAPGDGPGVSLALRF